MSRSRRKNPICGYTCAESEKGDKRRARRRLRRAQRMIIVSVEPVCFDNLNDTEQYRADPMPPLPVLREVSNVWLMGKDGKHYHGCDADAKVLRK